MPIGKRQKAVEAAKKRIDKVRPMTEKEVREKLHRIRDIHLLIWLMESEAGQLPNRERVSQFNQAQHQLERHRLMNPGIGEKVDTEISIGYEFELPDRNSTEQAEA